MINNVKATLVKILKKASQYLTLTYTYIYGFIACVGLLSFAAYLQINLGEDPCPLCIVQRLVIVILGLLFFSGMFLPAGSKTPHKVLNILLVLVSLIGSAVAGRQVWLQSLPEGQAPQCGPGLDYMLQNYPLTDTLKMLLHGSGECAEVHWTLFGYSIPQWTLAFFVAVALLGIVNFIRSR